MWLALDTSTRKALIAIRDGETVISRQFEPRATQRVIFAELASALADGRMEKLEGIAVGCGPGSFTGVKIGVMAAKTLSWAAGIQLVGIGSLDSVAIVAAAPSALDPDASLLVAVPSTMGEVYLRRYRFKDNRWIASGRIIDTPLEYGILVEKIPSGPLLISGEAAQSLAKSLGGHREFALVEHDLWYPTAEGIFSLADKRIIEGDVAQASACRIADFSPLLHSVLDDPLTLVPDYIRLSQPERLSEGSAS